MTTKTRDHVLPSTGEPIDPVAASAYVEGWGDGEGADWEDQRACWQYLQDTRLGYQLQGWYGRSLQQLIAAGELEA